MNPLITVLVVLAAYGWIVWLIVGFVRVGAGNEGDDE